MNIWPERFDASAMGAARDLCEYARDDRSDRYPSGDGRSASRHLNGRRDPTKTSVEPRHGPQGGMSVEVATTSAAIEALEEEWTELERRTPEATGFQSFRWCHAWMKSTGEDVDAPRPHVVVVRQANRAMFLLPLQIETRFGIRWARGLGQPVTPYADALAVDSPRRAIWRGAAIETLRRLEVADVMSLIQVRADGVLATSPGTGSVKPTSNCAPALDLKERLSVVADLASGRSLRRRRRALSRDGTIAMETLSGSRESVVAVRHAVGLKKEWLRARRLPTSGMVTPSASRFLEALALRGHIEVCRLRVGSRIVALDIGFVDEGSYRSLLSTYDARFGYGSPGHVLTHLLIDRCAARGLREFDLLAPREPYKEAISSGSIEVVAVHEALTMLGRFGMFASLRMRWPYYAARHWQDRFFDAATSLAARFLAILPAVSRPSDAPGRS